MWCDELTTAASDTSGESDISNIIIHVWVSWWFVFYLLTDSLNFKYKDATNTNAKPAGHYSTGSRANSDLLQTFSCLRLFEGSIWQHMRWVFFCNSPLSSFLADSCMSCKSRLNISCQKHILSLSSSLYSLQWSFCKIQLGTFFIVGCLWMSIRQKAKNVSSF